MNALERRNEINALLLHTKEAVSATWLSKHFSVSRQVIVGDIALLRAGGADITATPRGYVILRDQAVLTRRIACRHSMADMPAELYAIVDQGCTVADVIVEHPIYGQLTGLLRLSERADVEQFMLRCQREDAQPLSTLTDGIHLHTILAPDEGAYLRVMDSLRALGILIMD